MQYETLIFPRFFTHYDKETDVYKDANDKGVLERYNEIAGWHIDEDIKPLIDNLLQNTIVPATALSRYVPFIESGLGFKRSTNNLYLSGAIPMRRAVLEVIHKLYDVRGTIKGYEIPFAMLGMTSVVLTEHANIGGFDSLITFDDPVRTFDSTCNVCSEYSIALTGSMAVTTDLLDAISSIIAFNQPINIRLRAITYNGGSLLTHPDFNSDFNNDFLT